MSAETKGRLRGFSRELASHGARRPWLWAVPAAGLVARRLIGGILEDGSGRGLWSVIVGLFVTLAVAAAFAELWISESGRPDARRYGKAFVLFLLPYPALALVGWLSAELLELIIVHTQNAPRALGAFVAADLALSKVVSLGITLLSALAFACWRRDRGMIETLRAGWRALRANVFFIVALGASAWIAQEALSVLFAFGREAAAGASPESFGLAGLAQDYLLTLVPLVACVAAPIQAFKSGRLLEP